MPSVDLEYLAAGPAAINRVDDLSDDRNTGKAFRRLSVLTSSCCSPRDGPLFAEALRLGTQHQMRESRHSIRVAAHTDTWSCNTCRTGSSDRRRPNRPISGRYPAPCFPTRQPASNKRRKGMTQIEAAPATVTDVEYALELRHQRTLRRRYSNPIASRWGGESGASRLPSRLSVGAAISGTGAAGRCDPAVLFTISRPANPALSGSDLHETAPLWRASRTSQRFPRSPRHVLSSPYPGYMSVYS